MPHDYDDETEALGLEDERDKAYWKKRFLAQKAMAKAATSKQPKAKEPVAKKKKEKSLSERMYEDPEMAKILAGDQKKAFK